MSAGYDAHADDPLGGMRCEQGFAGMASRLLDVTHRFAGGRLVAVLEGGYDSSRAGAKCCGDNTNARW